MSLILGLDVQVTRLGWALADAEDDYAIACGCESISATCPGDDLRRHLRWTIRLVAGSTPGPQQTIICVYVEAPHVGPNLQGSMRHAMMIGRALQAAEMVWSNAPVQLIQPADWKRLVGLKGNAGKPEVAALARHIGFNHPDQDALDAGLIAIAGALRNREIVQAAGG